MKDEILRLRSEGKTYNEIKELLGCSKSTISYHCGEGQKEKKTNRQIKNRKDAHPFVRKIQSFFIVRGGYQEYIIINNLKEIIKNRIWKFCMVDQKYTSPTFTVEDVIKKLGESPKCYLTGEEIDISKPKTYQFDHIIPRSRGGDNSIENLGVCTKRANMSKNDMTPEEYLELCEKILKYHGYKIEKPKSEMQKSNLSTTTPS